MSSRWELYQNKVDNEILTPAEIITEVLTGIVKLRRSTSAIINRPDIGGIVTQYWGISSSTPQDITGLVMNNKMLSIRQATVAAPVVTGAGVASYETISEGSNRYTCIIINDPSQDITITF